ncbi:hypothetical protein MFLAVUS_005428 [Mucor flavus]|uniref:Uncharacterized protein n=1 Tax=Mucor flavus TaxID=439312 RepID=A0ABP9YYP1_9FUNG
MKRHHYKKNSFTTQEMPPTPSSSAMSFLVTDQKSFDEEEYSRLPLNTAINTTPPSVTDYGSLSSDFTYFQAASPSTRSSPAASTISPNDDDEGLYLLWTHQLLRERGYSPSSCKLNSDEEDENYSIDSSITDLSVGPLETFVSTHQIDNTTRPQSKTIFSSYTPSWLASCFPTC